MGLIKYTKQTFDNQDVWYEILDDGFQIYIGTDKYPQIVQQEPYIPDHSLSYEENALSMCEDCCKEPAYPPEVKKYNIDDRLTSVEANIDYLMLLNDPDSASETVTE